MFNLLAAAALVLATPPTHWHNAQPEHDLNVDVGTLVVFPANWPDEWPPVVLCMPPDSVGRPANTLPILQVRRAGHAMDLSPTLSVIREHFRNAANLDVELEIAGIHWVVQRITEDEARAFVRQRSRDCARSVLARQQANHDVRLVRETLFAHLRIRALWPRGAEGTAEDRWRTTAQVAERIGGKVNAADNEMLSFNVGPLVVTLGADPSDEA